MISAAVAGTRPEAPVPLDGPLTETVPDSVPRRRVTALARVPAELADAVPAKVPTTAPAERKPADIRQVRPRAAGPRPAKADPGSEPAAPGAPARSGPAEPHPVQDKRALLDPAATVLLGAVGAPARRGAVPKAQPQAPRRGRHAGRRARSGPEYVEPQLAERPGAVLPGWAGMLAGLAALLGCGLVAWGAGAVPEPVQDLLGLPYRPYRGLPFGVASLLALGVLLVLFAFGGLTRGRVGTAWVLTLFGQYRGTVRRTGLLWVSPLLLRRRLDVRLRHWRSEPVAAVDANGTALRVVVLVVWRIKDTVRAAFGVADHETYLREQVEAALARVLSQRPVDAPSPYRPRTATLPGDAPTLRDAEAVGEALTRTLAAACAPVGIEVFSAQPVHIEYAPEIAAAMRRRRIAAIEAEQRDAVLSSVVDTVDDVVHRLTARGLVELDDYDRKTLVKDLTVAFCAGHGGPVEGA